MELAPAQLPYERLGPGAAGLPRPVHQLDGGQGAEVQVRREARGAVARQVVVLLLVRTEPAPPPGRERLARRLLPALREPLRHAGHAAAVRDPLRPGPRGHPYRTRRTEHIAQALPRPAPEVRGEHGEVVRGGGRDGTGRHRGDHPVVDAQPPPAGLQRLAQPFLAAPGVRADARSDVDLVRTGLRCDRAHLLGHVPGPDDEPAAPVAQPGVEVAQAAGEEGAPVRGVEAGRLDRAVPDEQGHDLVGGRERGPQRRVVVQAEIGGEQDDRNGHGATPEEAGTAMLPLPCRPGTHRSGRHRAYRPSG